MLDKQGVANAIKAQFPHARIDKISEPSRAQMAHEAGETKKRNEEKKILYGEFGRYDRSRPKHSTSLRGPEMSATDIIARPLLTKKGKRLRLALYALRNRPEEKRRLFWDDPDHESDTRTIFGWNMWPNYRVARQKYVTRKWAEKSGLEIPDYPTEFVRRIDLPEYRKATLAQKKLGTYKKANGELINENLGCVMTGDGAPEIAKALLDRGDVQVRRDQNGNECAYLVSKSRKHQAEQIKEFNRMQKDAAARGWQGTYAPHEGRTTVQYIRHGGLTPD